MKNNLTYIVGFLVLVSCGTMRLQLKSPYKSQDQTGFVTYERSYDVGGAMPLWCGLTFIFYGGACWAYVAMPFVPQEDQIKRDALTVVNTHLGTSDVVLLAPVVDRISWSSAETFVSYEEEKTDPVNP